MSGTNRKRIDFGFFLQKKKFQLKRKFVFLPLFSSQWDCLKFFWGQDTNHKEISLARRPILLNSLNFLKNRRPGSSKSKHFSSPIPLKFHVWNPQAIRISNFEFRQNRRHFFFLTQKTQVFGFGNFLGLLCQKQKILSPILKNPKTIFQTYFSLCTGILSYIRTVRVMALTFSCNLRNWKDQKYLLIYSIEVAKF